MAACFHPGADALLRVHIACTGVHGAVALTLLGGLFGEGVRAHIGLRSDAFGRLVVVVIVVLQPTARVVLQPRQQICSVFIVLDKAWTLVRTFDDALALWRHR